MLRPANVLGAAAAIGQRFLFVGAQHAAPGASAWRYVAIQQESTSETPQSRSSRDGSYAAPGAACCAPTKTFLARKLGWRD